MKKLYSSKIRYNILAIFAGILIVLGNVFYFTAEIVKAALDATFDTDGKVVTAVGTTGNSVINSLAIQSNGKIIAGGAASDTAPYYDFALARYNSDGSLDTGFDSDGMVMANFGATGSNLVYSVAIQGDGKIVAAGQKYVTGETSSAFGLMRFNADGSLDTGFDTDGKVVTNLSSSDERIYAIAIQSNGKIVAVGDYHNGTTWDFAVARYNTDGSLDTGFDTDGILFIDFGGFDKAQSVAIQSSDQKIVVGGYSGGNFAIARLNTDGSLDTNFNTDGKETASFGGSGAYAFSLGIQSDGKIVMAGYTDNGGGAKDFAIARFSSFGDLDVTFGNGGKTTTDFGQDYEEAHSLAIRSDGRIVVGGFSYMDFAVARYNQNGTLDNTFGTSGKDTADFNSSEDIGYAIANQSDNKIIVGGYGQSGYRFAMARFQASNGANHTFPVNCYGTSASPTILDATWITSSDDVTFTDAGGDGYCIFINGFTANSVTVGSGVTLDVDYVTVSGTSYVTLQAGSAIISSNSDYPVSNFILSSAGTLTIGNNVVFTQPGSVTLTGGTGFSIGSGVAISMSGQDKDLTFNIPAGSSQTWDDLTVLLPSLSEFIMDDAVSLTLSNTTAIFGSVYWPNLVNFTQNSGTYIDASGVGCTSTAVDGAGPNGSNVCTASTAGWGDGFEALGGYQGGGHGGTGGVGTSTSYNAGGATYGSSTDPTLFGSSGGGWSATIGGGGPGGGRVIIRTSGTFTHNGSISAAGSNGYQHISNDTAGGGGSGGSINITSSTYNCSTGTFDASGGDGGIGTSSAGGGGGGGGRAKVGYITDSSSGCPLSGLTASSVAPGGTGQGTGSVNGGTGSLSVATMTSTITCAGSSVSPTPVDEVSLAGYQVTFNGTGWCQLDATLNAYSVDVGSGVVLTHPQGSTNGLFITTAGNFNLQSGAIINLNDKGYSSNQGPCKGIQSTNSGGGGAHGGNGGSGGNPGTGGSACDDVYAPAQIGSGGGYDEQGSGGIGGGYLHLDVTGTLTINGSISANGQSVTGAWDAGAGAGGGVYLETSALAGGGTISTLGGNANNTEGGGGGGGGRVAIYYDTDSSTLISGNKISINGGDEGNQSGFVGTDGGSGTIYLKDNQDTYGRLVLNNAGMNTSALTPQLNLTETYDIVTISEGVDYEIGNGETLNVNTTLNGGTTVNGKFTINSGGILNPPSGVFDRLNFDHDGDISNITSLSLTNSNFYNNGTFSSTLSTVTLGSGGNLLQETASGLTSTDVTIQSGGIFTQYNSSTVAIGSVEVQSGGNFTHGDNSSSKQYVINVSTSDFDVKSGGTVNVNGLGFNGDLGPGKGDNNGQSTVASGASHGGWGGKSGSPPNTVNPTYGSITQPVDIGSGGGHDDESGGLPGGGAVKIVATGTLTINGSITANAAGPAGADSGGASGGSVWLDAGTLAGNGSVTSNGGDAKQTSTEWGGGGAGGRVAVYYGTGNPLNLTALSARGGKGAIGYATSDLYHGGAGTVYLKQSGQTNDNLIISNSDYTAYGNYTPHEATPGTFDNLTISGGAKYVIGSGQELSIASSGSLSGGGTQRPLLTIDSGGALNMPQATSSITGLNVENNGAVNIVTDLTLTNSTFTHNGIYGSILADLTCGSGCTFIILSANNLSSSDILVQSGGILEQRIIGEVAINTLTVQSGGTVTHPVHPAGTKLYELNISGTTIDIQSGGSVNVDSKGYLYGYGPGKGGNVKGAGHGGNGYGYDATYGNVYGSVIQPTDPGSGGGGDVTYNLPKGGGVVKLNASGTLTIAGSITATGGRSNASYGSGAGGSVWLTAGTLAGSGLVTANGGDYSTSNGGPAGGGGRVAVYYTTDSSTLISGDKIHAYSGGGTTSYSGAGTVYIKQSGNGNLLVDNNNLNGTYTTQFSDSAQGSPSSPTYDNVTIRNGAKYLIPNTFSVTITPGGNLTGGGSTRPSIDIGTSGTPGGTFNLPNATQPITNLNVTSYGAIGVVTNLTLSGSTFTHNGSFSESGGVTDLTFNTTASTFINNGTGFNDQDLVIGNSGTYVLQNCSGYSINSMTVQNTGTFEQRCTGTPLTITTVTVNSGGTLTHTAHPAGTKLYELNIAATSMDIQGSVNVNSKGYLYGQGPGKGGNMKGGGHGGNGYGYDATYGNVHGSVIQPADPGSGGGGDVTYNLSKGGGVVKLNASGTLTVTGSVTANGGQSNASYGSGAGGSVWLTAGTLAGGGTITANGGDGYAGQGGPAGGGGRVAVYYTTDSSTLISGDKIHAYSGGIINHSGAGTVYIKQSGNGNLLVDNNNLNGTYTTQFSDSAQGSPTSPTYDNVTVKNYGKYLVPSGFDINATNLTLETGNPTLEIGNTSNLDVTGTLTIKNTATLTHSANSTAKNYALIINAGNVDVQTGGTITANGKGFTSDNGTGKGGNVTSGGAGGAGYGGVGGAGSGSGGTGGSTYGSSTEPIDLGSGGGKVNTTTGGSGGGQIKIIATGTTTVNGSITSNGLAATNSNTGGGAGGSIWIDTNTITGTGSLTANGGTGNVSGGGGAGGRISVTMTTNTSVLTKTASGGAGYASGSVGTINWPYTCGDNEVTGAEECDDGNTDNGDGCSSTCQISTTGYAPSPIAIAIFNNKVDADLTNFPMLLSNFGDSTYSNTKADGSDILFSTDSGGSTQIPFEVVSWNTVAKTGEIWVKVPSLANATDTTIYMWYNNPSAIMPNVAADNGKNNVWDSNFKGIWHLSEQVTDEQTTGTHYDSTTGGYNGAQKYNAYNSGGKIGGAQTFDASSDYIEVPTISIPTSITVSAWAKASTYNQNGVLALKNPINTQWAMFFNSGSTLYWRGGAADSTVTCSLASLSTNTWHLFTGKQTGTTGTLYIDGVQCDDGTLTAIANGAGLINFGRYDGGYYYSGSLDEVHISDTARPTEWISTEYNNQSSPSTFSGYCGNGVITGSEQCDDGNFSDGDGCSDTCQISKVGYASSQVLTIDHTKVGENLSNFTVLLKDANFASDVYSKAEADGKDLLFTSDEAGTTFLPFEIVSWNTGGTSEIWVKVPSLSTSTDTTFWVWYDNSSAIMPGATANNGKNNVWDSDYKAVWHLNENPAGTAPQILDSTTNSNNGTANAAMTIDDRITGVVGNALNFDNDGVITVPHSTSLNITGTNLTIELWAKGSSTVLYDSPINKASTSSWADGYGIFRAPPDMKFYVTGYTANVSPVAFSDNTWYHIVGVYDGANVKIYKNAVVGTADPYTGSITTTTANLLIGNGNGGAYYWNGDIDEIRVSNYARSTGYITTTFNNQNSPSTFIIPPVVCGDGAIGGSETCDDSNTTPGDGCSAVCAIESGYECTGTPSSCHISCGDGTMDVGEQCDDSNTNNGDGCSSACQISKTGYVSSQVLTIDHTKVGETVTNFPVLVKDTNFLSDVYTNTLASGADLLFTSDAGGTTFIPFEVVSWNKGASTSEVWVKVPSVSSTAPDTTFYVWYNNSSAIMPIASANNGENNVWDSNYKGVWHLNEDVVDEAAPGDTHYDSTSNSNNGTQYGNVEIAQGPLPYAQDFDGTDDYVDISDSLTLSLSSGLTLSTWINSSTDVPASTTKMSILERGEYGDPRNSLSLNIEGDGDYASFGYEYGAGTNQPSVNSTSDITDGNWHNVIGVWDGSNCLIYVDGAQENSRACANTPGPYDQEFYIGKDMDGVGAYSMYFDGTIDEVHISDSARSAGWITTEYNNQNSPSTFIIPPAVCGDGIINGTDQCDDGNTSPNDGCSTVCAVESGYECVGTTPSVCHLSCGDGTLDAGEACDDGDTSDGDGCSAICAVETGYECAGTPSVCVLLYPNTTNFPLIYGTTNFTTVPDLEAVSNMKLANQHGYIKWKGNNVFAKSEDYDSYVRVGSGFVSMDPAHIHNTLSNDTGAVSGFNSEVKINVAGCESYTVYYASGFRSSLQEIKTNGQVCNASTTPACTNIRCVNGVLTFDVPHFDGYGGEGQGAGLTTTVGVANLAPILTAPPSDGGSTSSSPANVGSNIAFTGTAKDLNGNQYYLAICKTDAILAGNNTSPTCPGSAWTISVEADSEAQASVNYTAQSGDPGSSAWYAFVCDKVAGTSMCLPANSSGDKGFASGVITFSNVPADGTTLTIDGTVYEFDTANNGVTGGNVDVNSAVSESEAEAADALVTVDNGGTVGSHMIAHSNFVYVYADMEGAGGNSIGIAEANDTGNALSVSGANLTGGNDANASPMSINHAGTFGTVTVTDTSDGTIEPGDTMKFKLANAQIDDIDSEGSQDLMTMYICTEATTAFDYNANTCTGGTLICSSSAVDPTATDATCSGGANLISVPKAHGSYNFKIYAEDNHNFPATGTTTQSYSVTDVPPTLVSYTVTDTPNVSAGGSDTIDFSAVISDNNGDNDVTAVDGVLFDDDTVDISAGTCAESENNCYLDTTCDLTNVSGTDIELTANCQITMWYNANDSANWEAHVNPTDGLGRVTGFADSNANLNNPALSGINVEQAGIAYGTLVIGTVSDRQMTTISNMGNVELDIMLSGTDMSDGGSNTIDSSMQKWYHTDNDFNWNTAVTDPGPYTLVESAMGTDDETGCLNRNIEVRTVHTTPTDESIWWKLKIPNTQSRGTYTGANTFTATAGETCVDGKSY